MADNYAKLLNPERALIRRNYVLQRMHELGFIDEPAYLDAVAEVDRAVPHEPPVELEASYAAEMARQAMVDRYGADAFTGGYRAYTTLDSRIQEASNLAIRDALQSHKFVTTALPKHYPDPATAAFPRTGVKGVVFKVFKDGGRAYMDMIKPEEI